jgi:O-antigen/teichoic acid export membrane protein
MSVARHSAYNLAGSLVPIAVSLVTIPPYIAALGEARYGVLAMFGLLLGYFGVFDFGLSTATAQRIAANPESVEIQREVFWTGAAINLLLGLVGGLAILPAAFWFFGAQLRVEAGLRPEMLAAAWWLALAVPTMLLTGVLRGALQGARRFAELNLVSVMSSLITQVLPLAAVWWIAPTLVVALPVLFLSRLVTLAAMALAVRRWVLGEWRPRLARARARDLLGFGGWVAVSSLISPLMTILDRFAIGAIVGARAVSHYTVPYQLGERSLVLPVSLAEAVFPRMASAGSEARMLLLRSLGAISMIMAVAMAVAIVAVKPFLALWISPGFAEGAGPLARILFLGFFLNAVGICCIARLQADGAPRLVAIAHVLQIVPYALLLYVLLKEFGVEGAAFALVARLLLDFALLTLFNRVFVSALKVVAAPFLLLVVTAALCQLAEPAQIGLIPGAAAAIVTVCSCGLWLVRNEPQLFARLRRRPA